MYANLVHAGFLILGRVHVSAIDHNDKLESPLWPSMPQRRTWSCPGGDSFFQKHCSTRKMAPRTCRSVC